MVRYCCLGINWKEMGYIAICLVFLLSPPFARSSTLAISSPGKNIVSNISNSLSQPPGNPDANYTKISQTLEKTLEQLGQLSRTFLSEKKQIRSYLNDHEEMVKPTLLEKPATSTQNVDTDDDNINDFAVFVDSPDSDESYSDGELSYNKHITNGDESDNHGYMANETSMEQVLVNNFRNGSVIHDIHIAVKHPQNLKGPKYKKAEQKKVGTAKNTSYVSREKMIYDNCSNSPCPGVTSGKLIVAEVFGSGTIPTDESHLTKLTDAASLGDLSMNSTETDLAKDATVAEELASRRECPNIIYLNMTGSENYVSRCLISCIANKSSVMGENFTPSTEKFSTHNKSLSILPIRTYPPSNGDNSTTTEHLETVNSTDNSSNGNNSSNSTKLGEPTSEETTVTAPLNLHVPIGSVYKKQLLETSEVKKSEVPVLLKDICLTETCVMKAADLLKRMNTSVDPCYNFYEFSCGGFLKHEIPDDDLIWSVFHDIGSDIIFRVISILREPAKISEPTHVKELKIFHSKCVKTPAKYLLLEALQELGGWPAPHNPSWKIPSLNWQDIAFNWTYGVFVEHQFLLLNISYFNKTGKWVLNLDLPIFVRQALNSNSLEVLKTIEHETAALAEALEVDSVTIVASIELLHLFMEYAVNYANLSQTRKQEAFFTLEVLRNKFPHLTLLKNLPSLLETAVSIDDNELIRVGDLMYLEQINTLIRDTPVKTQAALQVMSAMRVLSDLVKSSKDISMARYCVKLAWQLYPKVVESIYASRFVDDSALSGVMKILSEVKNHLEKTLKESSLNSETKLKAVKGLKSLSFIVSKRNGLGLGRTGLTEMVNKLNSSFASMVKAGMWYFKQGAYALLHQDYESTLPSLIDKYSGNRFFVNAFIMGTYVFIPLSIIHDNIYSDSLPFYVNFAGVGVILGHEIMHGVVQGELFQNASRYVAGEQCLIEQFSDFTERYLGLPIDGRATKEENLADLGGIREAYLAYTEWIKQHSENERKLPGLHHFNSRQMFWLTAASNWCQAVSREAMMLAIHMDSHAPSENRINGQLANLPEFSQDFHCPLNSPMNPKDKCSLW